MCSPACFLPRGLLAARRQEKKGSARRNITEQRNSWSPFYLIFVKVLRLKNSAEMPGYHWLAGEGYSPEDIGCNTPRIPQEYVHRSKVSSTPRT